MRIVRWRWMSIGRGLMANRFQQKILYKKKIIIIIDYYFNSCFSMKSSDFASHQVTANPKKGLLEIWKKMRRQKKSVALAIAILFGAWKAGPPLRDAATKERPNLEVPEAVADSSVVETWNRPDTTSLPPPIKKDTVPQADEDWETGVIDEY